ncbi:MAG TPA: nucleoside deaminase [Tenuifilaceae bacterium]|nr:nucleoside deaminase [Tenuifilaceae bacterium]
MSTKEQTLENDEKFMDEAIELAIKGVMSDEGGPFGAIVVKDGRVVGKGNNHVTSTNDPTAHAEVMAIRDACRTLNTFQLNGCVLYTSCEPCPMCLGAIYWARLDKVFYSANRHIASYHGFDDSFIYNEVNLSFDKRRIPFINISPEKGLVPFREWEKKDDKIKY